MPTLNRVLTLLVLTCLVVVPTEAQNNNEPPKGFTALFDGQSLQGWTGGKTQNPENIKKLSKEDAKKWRQKMDAAIAKHWRVEDGVLINDGKGANLVTLKDYGDFEFWIDYKFQPGGDSGVYLRGMPQVQIWDPDGKNSLRHGSAKGSGGLWNNKNNTGRFPTQRADKPVGQWNRMYVRMVGPYVTVKLNGVTVLENVEMTNHFAHPHPVPKTGPFHLQIHGTENHFRNIFVRELSSEESTRALIEITGKEKEFTSIFNGKDFTGWAGAVNNYQTVDGTIQCKKGKGGTLITKKRYSDFAVRLEFKLPPGGNNGLAIRTPNARVNPAHDAMELQILDNTHPKYKKLKPDQFHGSAYQIAPALRGYLRPVGEWNYQEVIVKGDHVRVFLNGYKILDIHTSKANPKHPTNQFTEGHFGFCGHHDPVQFRNIRIRELQDDQAQAGKAKKK